MNRSSLLFSIFAVFAAVVFLYADDEPKASWKAGSATATITPHRPMPMSGYASRKDNPAEGTEQDLFAKALAIEDAEGNRLVFVTTDLIGIIAKYRADVEQAVGEKFNLAPHSLVMNASHTHCGPSYGRDDTQDYYDQLVEKTVGIIGEALESMEPARLYYSEAKCAFAMNRRTPTPTGYRNHPNPEGAVDHTVPVLSVRDPEGNLKTALFGYACHNTTMGFMKWFGDYAGYAQEYLEADHEGLTAMFMNGCSGDQNPYPRRMLYFAQRHGRSLATAVEAALEVSQGTFFHQKELNSRISGKMDTVKLSFTEESGREDYEYPVQVIRIGDGLSMITMAGEVTIDYSLRLKKELATEESHVWVAGYTNDYNGYVPSKRVLLEGGYEANSRPWNPDLEERIIGKIHEMAKAVTTP
ncbi:MAG: neutral/alkaline non-lysosomal ceramidase N-terminal domain-containing protein [Verrucomicrobiales bacterium]|nr:neutral/alkaline non-lysosomal ceramidase N-terminal domain-containing protein [Verrucomicrobiales bacterium]